jgi:uncharacterized protein (TIGR02996 family)
VSERAAFISAILADLADDTPRLVFADWLQENGEDERAEFIRCQIEAAKLPKAERAHSKPGVRALALEAVYGPAWRAAVGFRADLGRYERGFLTGIGSSLGRFTDTVRRFLVVEPLAFTLHFRVLDNDSPDVTLEGVERLAADPALRAVTKINNPGIPFGPGRFVRLIRSPHLVNLREVELVADAIRLEGVRAIVESPSAFVLESLDLTDSLLSDTGHETADTLEAVKLIATAPRFASLKRLSLTFNRLRDESIEILLASKTLPRALHLDLDDNEYDEDAFAEALAERFTGGFDGG